MTTMSKTERVRAKRMWKYTIPEIAGAANVTVNVAKYAREMKKFNPDSLRSVSLWVAGCAIQEMAGGRAK